MKKSESNTLFKGHSSPLFVSSLDEIHAIIGKHTPLQPLFICDSNTYTHCYLPFFSRYPVVTIPAGDRNKSLQNAEQILSTLLDLHADKSTLLIALGGGMITDITGFVASIYKRGVPFLLIPTSTLAIADAAIGGKTGINLAGFKNSVGTFYFPLNVIVHYPFLSTLPIQEYNSGWFEIVKSILLFDKKLSKIILTQKHIPTPIEIQPFLETSMRFKAKIVKKDPYEKGVRKALNYGHTVGHALEAFYHTNNQNPVLHGEAIGWGMQIENCIAHQLGLMSDKTLHTVNTYLNQLLPLPQPLPPLDLVMGFMKNDKKNQGNTIKMALLTQPGKFQIDCNVNYEELANVWQILSNKKYKDE